MSTQTAEYYLLELKLLSWPYITGALIVEFKRNASPETVQLVGALLRSYQAEVDQVTAR